jgi:hypothetical protein
MVLLLKNHNFIEYTQRITGKTANSTADKP